MAQDNGQNADGISRSRDGLRLAYLCDFSPMNAALYSGGNTRLFQALCDHVGEVEVLPNHWGLAEPIRWLIERTPEAIAIRLRWRVHLMLAPLISRVVTRALRRGDYDVLFCAYSYQSLYRVKVPEGMVVAYTSDATPSVYKNSVIGRSFGSYLRFSRLIDPLIEATERSVFRAADLLIWPSNWLRERAQERYGLDPDKAVKVPWGANIDRPEPDPDPPRLERDGPLKLLFVGRDWYAKGGPTTLATMEELRASGIDCRLTIVGSDPEEARGRDGVTIHPNLDKSDPEQLALFQSLYRQSHFMVLPSYESFGFAFCEASAFGLPSLCLSVGGIPIDNGMNGHALDREASSRDFARQIMEYWDAPEKYDALRLTTRAEYETALNWDVWGKRVAGLLGSAVVARRSGRRVTAVSAPSLSQQPKPSGT
jgi:glycosyltransferase involved in cell wall biosynthesis